MSRPITIRSLSNQFIGYYSAKRVLSKENLAKTAAKFANMPAIRFQMQEPHRKAAVLVALCTVDGRVSLLYTLRAPHLKTHRGQVSFPGGMLDDKDNSLEHTALRETKEELGLREDRVLIWGSGKFIVTRANMSVLPVIGQIKGDLDLNSLKVNHSEVEEVFTVALEELCHPKRISFTQFRNGYSTPVFLGGHRRIWGLTAMITHIFLRALLPSVAYTHKIKYVPSVTSTSSSSYFTHS